MYVCVCVLVKLTSASQCDGQLDGQKIEGKED